MTDADIKAIYDGTNKDMPFAEFRREIRDVMDPDKMVKDLEDIELCRARERINRMRIDKKLEKR